MNNRYRWISLIGAFLLALTTLGLSVNASYAQGDSRTFPETGKTVRGSFLTYWTQHGGLAQQGYPISDEIQQVSPTDGKTYTVQYFERAVFEEHPEFAGTPNEVLLSLLGVFRYQQKYPNGAPSQSPNNEINSVAFTQTGHRVGGKFLDYWNTHGGLAQQGYPISDEFIEISDLDGKPYKVQYFERAEFEEHPEFAGTPNEVLLSQLGTFAWQAKQTPQTQPTPTTPAGAPPAQPTATTPPTADCSQGVPNPKDATVNPKCGPIGTVFQITAHGFNPNEQISFWLTTPDQQVLGTPRPVDIGNHPGSFNDEFDSSFLSSAGDAANGIWAITYEGKDSHHQSIVWFKIVSSGGSGPAPTATPAADTSCSGIPASTPNIVISPSNCQKAGVRFTFRASGFQGGEKAGVYLTGPDQAVYGAPFQVDVSGSGTTDVVTLTTDSTFPKGVWAITFEGTTSHHKEIGYFKITP